MGAGTAHRRGTVGDGKAGKDFLDKEFTVHTLPKVLHAPLATMLASDWLASNLLSYREKCLWFRK